MTLQGLKDIRLLLSKASYDIAKDICDYYEGNCDTKVVAEKLLALYNNLWDLISKEIEQ